MYQSTVIETYKIYNIVQKSQATSNFYVFFFQAPRCVICYCGLKQQFSLQALWKSFFEHRLLFHSFSNYILYLTIFRGMLVFAWTPTYESFKNERTPNLRDEPVLCLHINNILAKNQEPIFTHFFTYS